MEPFSSEEKTVVDHSEGFFFVILWDIFVAL